MSQSPPLQTPPRGHTRNKSSGPIASRPRSATKGPLDAEDGLLTSPSTPSRRSASTAPQAAEARPKDFSFLLQPETYHPLTPLNVPLAFRDSPKQPDAGVPLEQLLQRGHFRAAAVAAVQELTGSGPGGGGVDARDAGRIFDLLYTRLACLTLMDATPLAAQEVKALGDLNSAGTYVDEATGEHLVPWELRVLIVRLQALGFGDGRRAVMSYYELARQARVRAARHDGPSRELWRARLHELGIKVAGALVDMDDLAGAAHHLDSLRDCGDGKLALAKALLWLHLGDADRARACAGTCGGDAARTESVVLALCDMADAEYEAALGRWRDVAASLDRVDEMVGVNTAVCLLYLGRMHEGRDMLEGLVAAGLSSHTLLFNLSTMYELCSDKHRELKLELAGRVARMDESPAGWEKTNADFKL